MELKVKKDYRIVYDGGELGGELLAEVRDGVVYFVDSLKVETLLRVADIVRNLQKI